MYNETVHLRPLDAARSQDEFVFYQEIIALARLQKYTGDALSGMLGRVLGEIVEYDLAQMTPVPCSRRWLSMSS